MLKIRAFSRTFCPLFGREPPTHSYRSATAGSVREARLAGR
jgi:hypothetical protein